MLKYLRITVTALSVTVCVLLVALWLRSHRKIDAFQYRTSAQYVIALGSYSGNCYASWFLSNVRPKSWELLSLQVKGPPDTKSFVAFRLKAFVIVQQWGLNNISVFTPHWFVASLFMALAAAPWLNWRFSLRALLIATTLVAVVLGIVVAAR